MFYPTVHPVLLYYGQDGCMMESNCTYTYALSNCPSRPIIPWTGWMVQWNPTVYAYALSCCPSHPIVPWTGWTVQWNPTVYIHMFYPVVHPILLYHGQDGCMMESNCTYTYALSYCPSRPIVPWTGWMVQWNPTVYIRTYALFYCPSHPIVPWTRWTVIIDGLQLFIQYCFKHS